MDRKYILKIYNKHFPFFIVNNETSTISSNGEGCFTMKEAKELIKLLAKEEILLKVKPYKVIK